MVVDHKFQQVKKQGKYAEISNGPWVIRLKARVMVIFNTTLNSMMWSQCCK